MLKERTIINERMFKLIIINNTDHKKKITILKKEIRIDTNFILLLFNIYVKLIILNTNCNKNVTY
jgi:hypothetical protein